SEASSPPAASEALASAALAASSSEGAPHISAQASQRPASMHASSDRHSCVSPASQNKKGQHGSGFPLQQMYGGLPLDEPPLDGPSYPSIVASSYPSGVASA